MATSTGARDLVPRRPRLFAGVVVLESDRHAQPKTGPIVEVAPLGAEDVQQPSGSLTFGGAVQTATCLGKMQFGPKLGAEMAGETPECCAVPKPAAPAGAPSGPLLPPVSREATAACQALELAGATSAAHSTGRQTKVQSRINIEECLPQHVLEAILGFLDRATLCTARLVSKTVCAAASVHIHSLTFQVTSQAVSCHRFP